MKPPLTNEKRTAWQTVQMYIGGIFAPILLAFLPFIIIYRAQNADSVLGFIHLAISIFAIWLFWDSARRNSPAMIRDIRKRLKR